MWTSLLNIIENIFYKVKNVKKNNNLKNVNTILILKIEVRCIHEVFSCGLLRKIGN